MQYSMKLYNNKALTTVRGGGYMSSTVQCIKRAFITPAIRYSTGRAVQVPAPSAVIQQGVSGSGIFSRRNRSDSYLVPTRNNDQGRRHR